MERPWQVSLLMMHLSVADAVRNTMYVQCAAQQSSVAHMECNGVMYQQ